VRDAVLGTNQGSVFDAFSADADNSDDEDDDDKEDEPAAATADEPRPVATVA
jgi:hypothetical protein